ncbi:MAG: urea transporter [Magnetococcales bacterium]|nr:urea transporter [Magnetococcales bacterium]
MTVPRGDRPNSQPRPESAEEADSPRPLHRFARDLVYGYGSFLFFTHPSANLLLIAATLMRPWVGLLGLLGGVSTLLFRQWLRLSLVAAGGLEVVNGILAGLLVGYFFAPDWKTVALGVCAGPFAILVSAWMGDALRQRNLPLLSGSFVLVGTALVAAGRALGLPYAVLPVPTAIEWLPVPLNELLRALGGIYLTRTPEAGALVFVALALSSRTLVMLALLAAGLSQCMLLVTNVPLAGLAGSSAVSAAIMAAIMTGGLFTTPGVRATLVALFSAGCATVVTLSLFNAFYYMALMPLSLPYLVITWLVMLTLRPERGSAWARYWVAPGLPERSMGRIRQAQARGLSPHSISLRAPFYGRWDCYQGYQGPHTHQGLWKHALDFHRLIDGQSYRGQGSELSDFHCFGQSVRSPVWGQVVSCRGDLPDNPPGEVDSLNAWGNYVLIGVGGEVCVLLAHLRQNSLTVADGAFLTPGQTVGQCGNSGRSPQPHLHLHVQDGFALGAPTRPFHLSGVCIGNRFLLDSIPEEGDSVSVPPVNEALKRSLHLQIGQRLTYATKERELTLEVDLDPLNHFALVGENGARIHLVETDNLLALFERTGPADALLDALVLAVGLTPLIDSDSEWSDAPPVALLPLPTSWKSLAWLLPGLVRVESHYRRDWEAAPQTWCQIGEHRLTLAGRSLWRCASRATLSEGGGILGFSLENGDKSLQARLIRVGFKSDTGVEGWDMTVSQAS